MTHRIRRVQQLRVPPTPYAKRFGLFAEALEVRTNDRRVLAAAEAAFGRFSVPDAGEPLVLRLVVEPATDDPPPLDPRGLRNDTAGHLLSIDLGVAGGAVADVATGFATGRVAAVLAEEPALLRYAFIEAMALAMISGGRGYVPIHASCVVRDGVGVILQGPAGAGKSTVAVACARRGWGLLAEDVVFARPASEPSGAGGLELWGMPWIQRLLPDAATHFPELASAPARLQANGERKLEVDLDDHAPGAATPRAAAGPIALLARSTGGPTRADWLDPEAAPSDVEVLWPWEGRWSEAHERTATRLLALGVLRLHVNGTPDEAVDALETALSSVPARIPAPIPNPAG